MLSDHILSTILLYGFHVTVKDYTSFDMQLTTMMMYIYRKTLSLAASMKIKNNKSISTSYTYAYN